MWDVDGGGDCDCVGTGSIWKLLSVQCCCEAKTSLKKKAYNYYVSMLDVYVYK